MLIWLLNILKLFCRQWNWMLHKCHFPIILYFDIKILFEDNAIAILF